MALRSRSMLGAALSALLLSLLLAPPPATAQAPRFDALVFSKTTGFRHESAIAAGKTALEQFGTTGEYNVTLSEDAALFTDAGLRDYEVVVFLHTDGEGILNAAQRTAFERWTARGGGIVSIHADANADRDWAWKVDMMGGALFDNHPSGALQFQNATVRVEDPDHPAMEGIPAEWTRNDEWYNFTAEPRGRVHVLATLDESTYEEQDGSAEADDHPIVWCSNYDGGRQFYTALGHEGAHWQEPLYRTHIAGAIEWAAGEAEGDCGEPRAGLPTDASFDKVTLDDTTENPMEIAVAPDGSVYYVELAGKVKRYDGESGAIRTVATIPVHRGNENGLLGITLDPGFESNRWLYLFYSAPSPEEQHVSRFTVAADGTLDMDSEQILLRIPHQRIICCHSAGSMTFGPDGNLYISTGDDTQHAESQGYNPIDDRLASEPGDNPDADHARDARRSAGNTNDLRGKILRITPKDDGTYTVPAGNLFGLGGKYPGVEGQTRPEIYTMGHRNPFRISVDQETGWLYNGEVGPDAGGENANRGPRGYDELNQIREAGNMGWPYCIADNKPYTNWDFGTQTHSGLFDCDGSGGADDGPLNDSAWNTGKANTPATTGALLWWPYQPHTNAPNFPWATPPLAIPGGPGRTAIAGPTYHFAPENPAESKFPAWFDDKVFFADWSRDWIATLELDEAGSPAAIHEFMPNADFRHPQDIEMGADGSLYVLEWGRDFNYAGSGINPDSGLYRIDYAQGTRTPVAKASADKDSGPAPLTVAFSSEGSEDADGDELTFAWDFDDGATSTDANPTHTFTAAGTYNVRLTATDSTGKSASSTVAITAGNTRPHVELTTPVQGGVFGWGDEIPYTVTVTDPEEATIDCDDVSVNVGVFHDEGGNAHVHPGVSQAGCSGVVQSPDESGHEKSANIALVLTATYTDGGGAPGSAPLEGASTRRLTPKTIQAEHYTAHTGTQTNTVGNAEGGRTVGYTDQDEWIAFEPLSLAGVDELTIRYAAGFEGGIVDVRLDAPDGPVVGTATLMPTASWTDFQDVTIPLDAGDGDGTLYFTFRGRPGQRTTDLFDLDEFTFVGTGVAGNSAPTASAQADTTAGPAPLLVSFTGTGADADGDPLSYAWDFTSDGTVDATTADASHTYAEPGEYTATFTVSDGGRSRSVEIDVEAYPPLASCPGNDAFDGTELDTSRWSVVREDSQLLSVQDGSLNITAQPGEDIHGGATGLRNIVLQDLPDSGPWTATTRVTWNPTVNYQNAGLVIYTDDANWIKSGMVYAGGRAFEAFKELDNSASGLGSATVPATFPSTFYVRFTSDGATVQAQRSADGETWTNTGNRTNLDGLTDPKVGMYATASTAAGTQANTASFDLFTLDAPQSPSDEFDGASLNLCRWSQIVRHEPDGYSVADGKLTLPAAHGDFFAAGPNNNPNILLQPAPSGAWTAEARLAFDPDENYEQAGLVVYGDDANYVKADYVHADGRGLEFLREVGDVAAGFDGFVGIDDRPTTVDLRIVSDGTTLSAYYRFEGEEWTAYGEPASLAAVPSPRIGVYANDANATVTTRDDAVFEYFRLVPGASDTTPPETTDALAPASPDGLAGWYKQAVGVTLSTEDGATTEYKVGDGEYQAYSAPFTLDQDGTHVISYRSTDAAGNAEAAKTATVKIDRAAPSSTATLAGAGPVTVTLAGSDPAGGSGLGTLEYRVDGGAWTAYGAPVTVTAAGEHAVEHRATDVAGNVGAVGTEPFTIEDGGAGSSPTVQAFADPPSGAAPLSVSFSAAGLDPDGGTVAYAWEFADGTAFGEQVTRTLTTAGVHEATVTVTDDEGDTASDTVSVTVSDPANTAPVIREASADRTSGPAPLDVWFQAVADDAEGGTLTYRWEFGDAPGSALGAEAEHTYLAPGTFTATLTVTDRGGLSDSETIAITVSDPPGNRPPSVEAAAVPASGQAPLDVTLSAQGSDPDGDALSYAWDFGDDSPVVKGRRARHVYTRTGTYTATVTATDKAGATDSATVDVVVGDPASNQAPTVQIAADPEGGSAPLTVNFSAAGDDPEGGALSYVWSFGDGGAAGGSRAAHTFGVAGTYSVTVTATDAAGATGTATLSVVVAAPSRLVSAGGAPPAANAPAAAGAAIVSLERATVASFARRGLLAQVRCGAAGDARASVWASRAAARRLGLESRRLGAGRVTCAAGATVAVRVKPSGAARRRLAGRRKALRVAFRLAPDGAGVLQRRVELRARR